MTELKNNTIMEMYNNFKKNCDHTYIHQFEDSEEIIAFAHGIIAAIYLLEQSPDDIIDTTTGITLSQSLDEILIAKTNLQ